MANIIKLRRPLILIACLAWLVWPNLTHAGSLTFKVALSGTEEVPPLQTTGAGTAEFSYDPATRNLKWTITYSGLTGTATMAHFHGPVAPGGKGPVVIWLSKKGSPAASPITGQVILTPDQASQFLAGQWYVNVHTQANPGGEIRGQAKPPGS